MTKVKKLELFCGVSKAFDRVWHDGLVLKAAGVTGNVLAWFNNYISNRKQRVILPSFISYWAYFRTGVPQGSVLGPLLFLLFVNDIVLNIGSNIRTFSDDTCLYIIVDSSITAAYCFDVDLKQFQYGLKLGLYLFDQN